MPWDLQQNHVFYFILMIITQVESIPLTNTTQLRSFSVDPKEFSSFDSNGSSSTTAPRYPFIPSDSSRRFNLKLIIILLAAVVLLIGIVRICFMIGRSSRPVTNLISSRRMVIPPPQIATITEHPYKPDLPPDYREAITQIDNDESKLPSYAELHRRELESDTHM